MSEPAKRSSGGKGGSKMPSPEALVVKNGWTLYAHPIMLDPAEIDAQRDGLLREWTSIVIDGK